MKTAIFIRSYKPDAPWLEYCLRSIRKFATGFQYVMVVIPQTDMPVFEPLAARYRCKLHPYRLHPRKPMLSSEVELCHADEICPDVDAVCTLDSDCVFIAPVSPADYLVGGKPILIAQSFEYLASVKNAGVIWRDMATRALGWEPTHETMLHPTIYLRGLFAPFRAAVSKHTGRPFDQYVLSCREQWPQTFAELTSLGAYAYRFFPEQYYFADVKTENINATADSGLPITANKLRQFWSHEPFTEKLKAELEAICS